MAKAKRRKTAGARPIVRFENFSVNNDPRDDVTILLVRRDAVADFMVTQFAEFTREKNKKGHAPLCIACEATFSLSSPPRSFVAVPFGPLAGVCAQCEKQSDDDLLEAAWKSLVEANPVGYAPVAGHG